MATTDQRRARLQSLIDAAGMTGTQAAFAIGRTPSRLGDYLAGRTVPSALVLLDLEEAAEQASKRTWMRAADVVDAVGDHADTDPILAMRMLLQGRDQSLALNTPARQAIWATGSPSRGLTGPWKTLTYQLLRDSACAGRPIPRWLVAPTPLERSWAPLPVREDRPLHQGLAKLGVLVNERDLLTV
ncbi:hypothetical protein GCM10023153_10400 [Ornithinibacter aureus]|uniref:Uncharacterized protein n=1 Tax=Ornithinibacter aureus TaxID=622664 RepID=A0ABP8JK13_9MICO|nr:helix-turn-helix transcriptional regulator [Ornithinibacter aureus]KAF0834970.1 hypothetical protein C8E84_2832 [Ornithinibacter aureus]